MGSRGPPPPPSAAATKLYVGHLPRNFPRRDLEDIFSKYGRILSCEIKQGGFAFIEFQDTRDAEDAISALDGYRLDGERITVEWSRRSTAGSSACFLCGEPGHWARDCPDSKEQGMDVRSGKCFKCGQPGHLARECRGGGGGGRSRSRSFSPRRDRRSSSRDRDYRRSPDGRRYDGPRPGEYRDYRSAQSGPYRGDRRPSYDDRAYDGPRGGGYGGGSGGPGRYGDYPPPHDDYRGPPPAGGRGYGRDPRDDYPTSAPYGRDGPAPYPPYPDGPKDARGGGLGRAPSDSGMPRDYR